LFLFGALCSALISPSYSAITGSSRSSVDDVSEVALSVDGKTLEIVMKGPADRWFSFGFGSSKMDDTYSIIVAGDSITEHILDMASPDQLQTTTQRAMITVQSDVTEGQHRTVTMTRSSATVNNMFEAGNLQIISATADPNSRSYQICSYHGRHRAADMLQLVDSGKSGGGSTKDSGGKSDSSRDKGSSSKDRASGGGSSRDRASSGGSSERGGGGRGGAVQSESSAQCIWNGEVKGLRADEIMLQYQCSQLAERECVTGGPLGQCQWIGAVHHTDSQLAADGLSAINVEVSTMDILLAIAFLVTAAFAVEQLYRWWVTEEDRKLEGLTSDARPLLQNAV